MPRLTPLVGEYQNPQTRREYARAKQNARVRMAEYDALLPEIRTVATGVPTVRDAVVFYRRGVRTFDEMQSVLARWRHRCPN